METLNSELISTLGGQVIEAAVGNRETVAYTLRRWLETDPVGPIVVDPKGLAKTLLGRLCSQVVIGTTFPQLTESWVTVALYRILLAPVPKDDLAADQLLVEVFDAVGRKPLTWPSVQLIDLLAVARPSMSARVK